jgi:hypothetical protein
MSLLAVLQLGQIGRLLFKNSWQRFRVVLQKVISLHLPLLLGQSHKFSVGDSLGGVHSFEIAVYD